MFPAYFVRTAIDWVRHNAMFKDWNPYSRCEESIKVARSLWEQQIGKADLNLLEPATVIQYWAEFFHAEDPLPDETEWREGLLKRSSQYESFEEWQQWFKESYAKVYKDDIIWLGVLSTSWAHTHQLEVLYTEESWEFRSATPYLQSSEFWRLEPHMETTAEVLRELWQTEVEAYKQIGFSIEEVQVPYLGKVEGLGFDTKKVTFVWPARAQHDKEEINLGEMVADIIAPPGTNWYRVLDNVIYAHDHLDITALINRATYVFGSHRRLMELTVDNGLDQAKIQALAEGWLVPS